MNIINPMRIYLLKLHVLFGGLGRYAILAISIVLVATLGWLDYTTGFEISFSFFYLIPILMATWYVNVQSGYIITVISILAWTLSNQFAGQIFSMEIIRYFNAFIRLAVFMMIARIVYELKLAIHHERTLAGTDPLTGIFNRREFYIRSALELDRAKRFGHPLSMIYFDLDQFKTVNDQQGPDEGDRQLQLIARTISDKIRKTDIFARLGGDEFALILPNASPDDAKQIVPKLVNAVKDELKKIHSPVTLSVGVVTYALHSIPVEEMLSRADALMFQAKERGKDQILYSEME